MAVQHPKVATFALALTWISAVAKDLTDVMPVTDCRAWAVQGQCRDNPGFMLKRCAASCAWLSDCDSAPQTISELRSRISLLENQSQQLKPAADVINLDDTERKELHAAIQSANEAKASAVNRSDALEAQVAELKAKMLEKDAASAAPAAEDPRIAELTASITYLQSQLTAKDAASAAPDSRIAELESSIAELQSQLSAKNSASAVPDPRIAELEKSNAELQARVSAQDSASAVPDPRVAELEKSISDLHARLSEKNSAGEEKHADAALVGSLEDEKAKLQADLEASRTAGRTLQTRIADLEAELGEKGVSSETRLVELEADRQNLTFELERARSAVAEQAGLEARIVELEAEQTHLKSELKERHDTSELAKVCNSHVEGSDANKSQEAVLDPRIAKLEAQVNHLNRVMESTRAAEQAASNQSDTFEARVLELEGQLYRKLSADEVQSDPWEDLHETVANFPAAAKKWVRELPATLSQLSIELQQQALLTGHDMAIYSKQFAIESAIASKEFAIESAFAFRDTLNRTALKAREDAVEAAAQAKLEMRRWSVQLQDMSLKFRAEAEIAFLQFSQSLAARAQVVAADPRFQAAAACVCGLVALCCLYFFGRFLALRRSKKAPSVPEKGAAKPPARKAAAPQVPPFPGAAKTAAAAH